MTKLYIGLMSGTSMDGIDAALVRFGDHRLDILATRQFDYPQALREELLTARNDAGLRFVTDVPALHEQVGLCFRDAALDLLSQSGRVADEIEAIGSHGQTLRHAPDASPPYSLQIGDADIIAKGTGIRTVADFRRADLELGGQGAPLAPAFHEWLFRQAGRTRVVLNIGGIANITVLQGDSGATSGYDTGPGNTLMDAWSRRITGAPFDENGEWAATGNVDTELLSALLADPYFALPPPKSTGFEHFNLDWLARFPVDRLEPRNVQATLSQLSADSIAVSIGRSAPDASEVLVCGGGVHNRDLMARLEKALPGAATRTTEVGGLDPDWVESAAFAWLAMRTCDGLPGNLPSVTGATQPAVLGAVHPPS
jgi:anhydro-N-acetylmuramic acid kinase